MSSLLGQLSISEISQRIVDIQESTKDISESKWSDLKDEVLSRHNNHDVLKADCMEMAEQITKLVEEYNSEGKKERDRVIKKVIAQRVELLIYSILNQENRLKAGLIKNKREYIELSKEIITKTIEMCGELLNVAITSQIFYPFVIKICRRLYLLSISSGYFIPIAYYALYMMNEMSKISSSSVPIQAISEIAIKVAEKSVVSNVYNDYVMNHSLDILADCVKQHSCSLSFPEYSSYIAVELKRIRNGPNKNNSWINTKTEGIVKAIKIHSLKIEKIRETVASTDIEAIRKVEEKIPEFQLNME
ncbi:hypothetical protein NEPAR06_2131 [Nematocida parisii]|uniref:Uncharacterized protein n=1 Tax=Nematocida parisii (strain ERTm3) TaxID=935791 RepID=I3EJU6_NEMP3|nr:uncharacterized protein NEPG_00980 [Nematocida parisii ERTm1]EIJ89493.1 hypothetical protein NEQG_00263 [Nematocida parisii ERTm3]KAI5130909.1 hypothetical protein NEPAR03_2235 [Nematocida parisii]EIJ94312.1 hypothetical protein NEPG_00980 [Nematocida parisii ERTm1]KAI5130936.1 hypothetical protein NEPAR08_2266 [Nematocida parisii]KAI5145055.1 hypothetical protein NEPAR04_2330 [Nematocida parisii]|eukprot:XP_013058808.1 hypothetical protein NEPG_00980 [Nematocida parisii ERTm1]